MKYQRIIHAALIVMTPLLVASCSTGQFGTDYKRTSSYKVNNPNPNPNPVVRVVSESSHSSAVRSAQNRGYVPIGTSTIYRRFKVPVQEARNLVSYHKGDMGVYSAKYLGTRSERVPVPVATTVSNAQGASASRYGNNYGYRSGYDSASAASSESTHYVYQNQRYKLYRFRATVLAHKRHLMPK